MLLRRFFAYLLLLTASTLSLAHPLEEQLPQANVAVYAINLQTHEELLSINANKLLMPGSTLKLLTALQADQSFESNFRFQTKVYRDTEDNLIIQFVGDPSLQADHISALAKQLIKLKQTYFKGNLIIDISHYIGHDKPIGWNWSDHSICFASENSAAQINQNCVYGTLHTDGSIGSIAKISYTDPIIQIQSQVRIVNPEQAQNCELNYQHAKDTEFTLTGCIAQNKNKLHMYFAVPNGNLYTAKLTEHILRNYHIRFKNLVLREQASQASSLTPITSIDGDDIQTQIRKMLSESDNHIAEQLYRNIAYAKKQVPISYTLAKQVSDEFINTENLSIHRVDGSGLSYHNRASAKNLVKLIERFAESPRLINYLPKQNEGTLRLHSAFRPYQLQGKTGSLYGVNSFAGILINEKGQAIALAYIINNYIDPDKQKITLFEKTLLDKLYKETSPSDHEPLAVKNTPQQSDLTPLSDDRSLPTPSP